MEKKTKALIQELEDGLLEASNRLAQCVCTCVDKTSSHLKECPAIAATAKFDALIEKAAKVLAEKPKGASFPMEYKGWTITIKMGHEFKGARGSVKNKRGYVATRASDKKVVEFAPSYDSNPSVQIVKIMIDAEERAIELYKR